MPVIPALGKQSRRITKSGLCSEQWDPVLKKKRKKKRNFSFLPTFKPSFSLIL
jgi:predicted nucleic acid-binding Zn ribbon protein